jgi:hypothetical protein
LYLRYRASDEPLDVETVEHLKALMDKGVPFHRVEHPTPGEGVFSF